MTIEMWPKESLENAIIALEKFTREREILIKRDNPDMKPTNPKDKDATDRIDLSLFPQTAVVYGSLGMTEGDLKYGGYNFRKSGVLVSTYIAAALRHIYKYYNGEEHDPKTKVPHLGSALACLAVIVDAKECNALRDDRPPKADMERLIDSMRERVRHLQDLFPNGPDRFTEQEHGQENDLSLPSR